MPEDNELFRVYRAMRRGILAVLSLAVLLPPTAVQADAQERLQLTSFRLNASNGYKFFVLAALPPAGDEAEHEGAIGIFLRRHRRGFSAASYAVPATLTRKSIEADLGKLGRISVTRMPTGHTKSVRRGCKPGSRKRVKAERYEGVIEFRGEEGFTEVNATGAPLEYVVVCRSGEEGGRTPGKSLPGARLDVERYRRENYRLEFDATQRRPGARTGLKAEVTEHRGEIEISRAIWTWASADALRYDRRLRSATVRPPAPFAGHAIYHRSARPANLWTGNLTVDLPGRSDVPITGRGFWADLEHPRR